MNFLTSYLNHSKISAYSLADKLQVSKQQVSKWQRQETINTRVLAYVSRQVDSNTLQRWINEHAAHYAIIEV